MAKRYTNTQLGQDLKRVQNEMHNLSTNFNDFQTKTNDKLSILHDFMLIAQDRDTRVKNGSGQVNWARLAEKSLAFLTPLAVALLLALQLLGSKL